MINLHQPYHERNRINEIFWKIELLFQNLLHLTINNSRIAETFLKENIRHVFIDIFKVTFF